MTNSYDPYYAPIKMPNGRKISGGAAFQHRAKLAGGPRELIAFAVEAALNRVNSIASNSAKVVPFPTKTARKAS